MTTIGFIGLGRMGSLMAANIAAADHPLVVHNRSPEKAEQFARDHGAEVAATPRDVAQRAGIIVTMLADGPALRDVYHGDDGVLAGLRNGTIGVDMSTVGPELIAELATDVAAADGRLVDAPVSGSVAAAEARTLMIMVGGDDGSVDTVRPILDTMGSPVLHVGGSGAGATMKLAVNSIVFGTSQAVAEALVMAERSGIDRAVAYDTFCVSAVGAPVVKYRRDWFVHPGERPVSFTVDLAIKDLDLITAHAREVGTTLPVAEQALAVLQATADADMGGNDMGDVAVYMRDEADAKSADSA